MGGLGKRRCVRGRLAAFGEVRFQGSIRPFYLTGHSVKTF